MGIDGLWELLEPAVQVCSLNDISLMNGFSSTKKGNILRIGVDISVVMNECVSVERKSHLYRYKTAGELQTFFYKLCKFLREAPVIMIFVFDGPNRPSFKHGRSINTQTIPDWSNTCKTIIEAFGFYWHQAPGEAEAELAMLSRCDAIDAVFTNDSDALVFGAQCVIKRTITILGPDKYSLYSMDVVENMAGLSRGGLLLVALLAKSDYSNGLVGCGPSISAALARCGFGDRILRAVNRLEDFKLRRELESITAGIQTELRNNSNNFLNSRYPQLASNFSIEIIAPDKIAAFLNPVVSIGSIPAWIAKEPSIPQIGRFCMQTLNWAHAALEKKLENVLWPGIFLRILTSPLLVGDHTKNLYTTPQNQTTILNLSDLCTRKKEMGQWARVRYSTDNFLALLGITRSGKVTIPDMRGWISADCLPADLGLVHAQPGSSHAAHASTSLSVASASSSAVPIRAVRELSASESESPDPPSIPDLLNSIGIVPNSEILEITDSESADDVEIVRSPHPCVRAFSPEVIVISD